MPIPFSYRFVRERLRSNTTSARIRRFLQKFLNAHVPLQSYQSHHHNQCALCASHINIAIGCCATATTFLFRRLFALSSHDSDGVFLLHFLCLYFVYLDTHTHPMDVIDNFFFLCFTFLVQLFSSSLRMRRTNCCAYAKKTMKIKRNANVYMELR